MLTKLMSALAIKALVASVSGSVWRMLVALQGEQEAAYFARFGIGPPSSPARRRTFSFLTRLNALPRRSCSESMANNRSAY